MFSISVASDVGLAGLAEVSGRASPGDRFGDGLLACNRVLVVSLAPGECDEDAGFGSSLSESESKGLSS